MLRHRSRFWQSPDSGIEAAENLPAAFTKSFSAFPNVNFGALLALIVSGALVDGIRPQRSARCATLKAPNEGAKADQVDERRTLPRARARFSSLE